MVRSQWTLAAAAVAALAVSALGSCRSPTTGSDGGDTDTGDCEENIDCPPGFFCNALHVCEETSGCPGGGCPVGTFCNEDLVCADLFEQCDPAGCTCSILSSGQQALLATPPEIVFTPGTARVLTPILTHQDGRPIPGARFTFELASSTAFSLSGLRVNALASAGRVQTTLTARAGDRAACTATIINLGDAPADGNLRILVVDELSGEPVEGAELHVDYDRDGVHDGALAPLVTTADGLAYTSIPPAPGAPYTITVFAAGFNYLTMVDLRAQDIVMPLSGRTSPLTVGGFTGVLDYERYEEMVLGGPGSLKFGIVGSSFPFKALLNFDLEPFFGPAPDADCQDVPTPPGCYEIEIPNLISTTGKLPGGVVLGLATAPIKPHFDVTGTAGRRIAWAIGGEVELEQISDFLELIGPVITCVGDCDFSIGRAFETLVPLMSRFAVGVRGEVEMPAAPLTDWLTHITPPYAQRADSPQFPRLDAAGRRVELESSLHQFVSVPVPPLPPDPSTGYDLEGLVLLTGVQTAGYGVVPLGVGTALDCTEGDCLDRVGNAANFDGIVNGARLCSQDPQSSADIPCPPGVPETIPGGHAAMFYGSPNAILGSQWVTGVVATPLSSVTLEGASMRATAMLFWEPPYAIDPTSRDFPRFPDLPAQVPQRSYTLDATSPDIDVNVATFTPPERVPGTVPVRWNVYLPNTTTTFVAPAVPAGFPDPLLDAEVFVSHLGFQLALGLTLDSLAENGELTLNDVVPYIEGVTYEQQTLPIVP